MKKLILLLILLFSYHNDNAVSFTNSMVDVEYMQEKWIKYEREMKLMRMVEEIEFQSEIKIPDYVDIEYVEFAYDLAKELELPTRTVFRLMYKESNFRDTVVSRVGAYGFMQLMPATREYYGNMLNVDSLFVDENQKNIYIGMNMLKDLHDYWTSRGNSDEYSWYLTLASYNAGKGKVIKYQGIPPYKETVNYVYFILREHSNPLEYTASIDKNYNLYAYENQNKNGT